MGQPTGGIEYLTLGSTPLAVGESCSYSLNDYTKTTITGQTGVVGTVKTPRVQFVEVEVNLTDDDDKRAIVNYGPGPVSIRFRNGEQYVLNDAEQVADVDPDATTGKATLRFEGKTSDGPY